LKGGSGIDTFVLRAGDGGSTLQQADVIQDFVDGTDVFGLADGLSFNDLVISQGSGTETVIKTISGEFIAAINSMQATNVTYLDFSGLSTSPQTITGTASSNVLIGAAGADAISGGGGSDVILGWGGDDAITVGGNGGAAFTTVVDGGAGANTLNISYVAGLGDFVSRKVTGDIWEFTDSNGGIIDVKNIFTLDTSNGKSWWGGKVTAGGKEYVLVDDMRGDTSPFSGAYGSVQSFVYQNGNSVEVAMIEGGKFMPQYRMGGFGGFTLTGSEAYTVYGSAGKDIVFTGYGADSISTGDGNDFIFGGDGVDTINAGAGDDVVYVSKTALTEDAVIDGGTGSNTLAFIKPGEAGGWDNDSYGALTLNMATSLGVATNFQNIVGTIYDDTIAGDANANVLIGSSGNDTLDGVAGNDILSGDGDDFNALPYGLNNYWAQATGNDILRGGAGNDQLFGGAGDDLLDGGTGSDTLKGGSGIDTFVLRAGDGGSTLQQADVIQDFVDGTDKFNLLDNLRFSDLKISQGTGNHLADTIIEINSTHEFLAILTAFNSANITDVDFE
jgi:Ca2+-binding RTX toxin-like protein